MNFEDLLIKIWKLRKRKIDLQTAWRFHITAIWRLRIWSYVLKIGSDLFKIRYVKTLKLKILYTTGIVAMILNLISLNRLLLWAMLSFKVKPWSCWRSSSWDYLTRIREFDQGTESVSKKIASYCNDLILMISRIYSLVPATLRSVNFD